MRIRKLIKESPSLASHPSETLAGSYVIGRGQAIDETQLPESLFPETCPTASSRSSIWTFCPATASRSGGVTLP